MREIKKIAVVGAGYMGGGIAQIFAMAGYRVQIADVSISAADAALERLIAEAQDFEDQGLFDAGSAALVEQNISAGLELEDAVADADFIEEAVFESIPVKHDVLGRISAAAPADAIIGTNTSTLPVRELDEAVKHPERFLTVHFSNPAPFIPGVELVAGAATDPAVVAAVKSLLSEVGCVGAEVADSPGMVLNRMQYALLREAFKIIEDGVTTFEDLDTIVRTTFGMRLGFFGPFAIADQAGLDVYISGYKTLQNAFGDRFSAPDLLVELVESGRHGLKTGRGVLQEYDDEDRKKVVDYRNRAYAQMLRLMEQMGPAPLRSNELSAE